MRSTNYSGNILVRYACLQILFFSSLLNGEKAYSAEVADTLYDLPLDQLVNVEVVSASRFKQKSSEAPSAVDVVTAKDIQNYGWRTLADALTAMRGLYVRNDRNYSYLGNRGFSHTGDYNSRVLFMIDGRRINDAIFDQGFIGEEFMVDMNLIERIEYLPGSGSSVYGGNALLGVINVITKQGKDFNGLKVSGEVGSFDTYRGRATYGKQWRNGTDLIINGSRYYSHGQEQLYFSDFDHKNGGVDGIAHDMDHERSSKLFGKLSYGDFTLRGGYVDRYKRVPTGAYETTFDDNTYFTVDQQAYIDLDYIAQIKNDLNLELRGFHHWSKYYQYQPSEQQGINTINYDTANARWWGGEIKLTGTQFAHHKWILGLEVQNNAQQQQLNYTILQNPVPYEELLLSAHSNGWRTGVYLQDEYHITDSLLLNVGLRLDQHYMLKNLQLNPRIGLIWDASPTITAKLLYGSAFRAPNAFERYYNIPDEEASYKSNPNNTEELIKSYEAIAEWRPGNGLKLLGTVFYNNLQNVLEKNITEADIGKKDSTYGMYNNTGHYQTYGFELGAEKRWDNGRQFKLSWTHNYTRDEQDDQPSNWAQNSPKNLVKLHYTEPFFNDTVRLSFEEIFVDQRRTIKISNGIAPSYHLLNIHLSLSKPLHGFQPTLGIYNVLDQHFEVLGSNEHKQNTLEMDGRTVRFRLEYGF
jgi:outer membrane receptor for ferrienterochelin and colicins